MSEFLLLDSGASFSELTVKLGQEQANATVIDQYALANLDIVNSTYRFLIIDEFVDQLFLFEQRDKIKAFLDEKNIVMFCGHIFTEWLPGASPFVAKQINSYKDYTIKLGEHPIFSGVISDDVTFMRGVAGFFSRGYHPLPNGAEPILWLAGDEPITYIDRQSTKGTILVHSGRNLLRYTDSKSTSGRIGSQLYRWLYEEYATLQNGVYA